jgi:glycosyltransferase involved in cell wall biosynthesis
MNLPCSGLSNLIRANSVITALSARNLAEISRHIDVCIVPSYFDTYNRVLREMLHLGLRSSRQISLVPTSWRTGKNGFKIPIGDGQALTEKMTEVLNDPA